MTVRFKQIELESSLFDLFVDVPIILKDVSKTGEKRKPAIFYELSMAYARKTNRHYNEDRHVVGAAFYLLNTKVQTQASKILLDGGPGQGKSTITQFICQIHRAKLLNKTE